MLLFPGVFSPCFYLVPCHLISIAAVLGATSRESGESSIKINADIPNGVHSNKSNGYLITHFLLGNKVTDSITSLLSNLTTDYFQYKKAKVFCCQLMQESALIITSILVFGDFIIICLYCSSQCCFNHTKLYSTALTCN